MLIFKINKPYYLNKSKLVVFSNYKIKKNIISLQKENLEERKKEKTVFLQLEAKSINQISSIIR